MHLAWWLMLEGPDRTLLAATPGRACGIWAPCHLVSFLQVRKDTDPKEIRANYFRLSRLVHPDKCSHPRAADASAIVNQVCRSARSMRSIACALAGASALWGLQRNRHGSLSMHGQGHAL